jgi:O-antigen/teichoic acid export membrane protein
MDIGHKALLRNTVLNLFGLVIPLAVGFVTIPMVVRALGNERFGILALVWVVFGYFGLFDLGLGRTTTRSVADALGRNETWGIPVAVSTTIGLQTALGLAAAGLSHLLAPLLARHILNIPDAFVGETIRTLRLVGWSLPVMFVSSSFRGVLEAAQRFDLVNAVKVPLNVLFYLLPLLGVALGYELPGIVVLLVLSRIAALVVWAAMALRVLPVLRAKPVFRRELVRPIFSFSGWLGLSGILFAVVTSIDRLIIGALITVEAVAFYSAPYEAINRIGVIPGSLGMVLFPAFSYLDAGRRPGEAESLFARSTKLLLLTTGPVFILLMFFAGDFLRLWLGPDYAASSRLVVQLLSAGFLVNTVFAVPNNYLLGIGRADIAPKYQAVELVVYSTLAWVGAKLWGIKGVALATALRLVAFTLVLAVASFKPGRIRFGSIWRNGLAAVLAILGLFAVGLAANETLGFGLWGAAVLAAAYAAVAYFRLLDAGERALIGGFLRIGRAATAARQEDQPLFGDRPSDVPAAGKEGPG